MSRGRLVAGWIAVSASTLVAGMWAFWGSVENFHEGWYSTRLSENLELMVARYLSPMLAMLMVSVMAILWPRISAVVFGAVAVAAAAFFHGARAAIVLISIPMVVLAVLYQVGRPEPRRWALRAVVGLPLLTAVVCGAYPGWRAVHRMGDSDYGSRVVPGNGITLVWAPEGPGWPDDGVTWWEAGRRCRFLSLDGRALADTPQDIWRLPTVEEAVRSMVYRGASAGGQWDGSRARYRVMPDKDSPLWKPHSRVIYWWTATEIGGEAYRIAYNGMVFAFPKRGWGSYWSCRCVRLPSAAGAAAGSSGVTGSSSSQKMLPMK